MDTAVSKTRTGMTILRHPGVERSEHQRGPSEASRHTQMDSPVKPWNDGWGMDTAVAPRTGMTDEDGYR